MQNLSVLQLLSSRCDCTWCCKARGTIIKRYHGGLAPGSPCEHAMHTCCSCNFASAAPYLSCTSLLSSCGISSAATQSCSHGLASWLKHVSLSARARPLFLHHKTVALVCSRGAKKAPVKYSSPGAAEHFQTGPLFDQRESAFTRHGRSSTFCTTRRSLLCGSAFVLLDPETAEALPSARWSRRARGDVENRAHLRRRFFLGLLAELRGDHRHGGLEAVCGSCLSCVARSRAWQVLPLHDGCSSLQVCHEPGCALATHIHEMGAPALCQGSKSTDVHAVAGELHLSAAKRAGDGGKLRLVFCVLLFVLLHNILGLSTAALWQTSADPTQCTSAWACTGRTSSLQLSLSLPNWRGLSPPFQDLLRRRSQRFASSSGPACCCSASCLACVQGADHSVGVISSGCFHSNCKQHGINVTSPVDTPLIRSFGWKAQAVPQSTPTVGSFGSTATKKGPLNGWWENGPFALGSQLHALAGIVCGQEPCWQSSAHRPYPVAFVLTAWYRAHVVVASACRVARHSNGARVACSTG